MLALVIGITLSVGRYWPAWAGSDPILTLKIDAVSRSFTRSDLLGRPDIATLAVPADPAYRKATVYRAVPLRSLLAGVTLPADSVLEAVAEDGFAAQLPLDLVFGSGTAGAVPWLAIELPDSPWPVVPERTRSAGPFYLVWEHPEASGVKTDQWPYGIARFVSAESPTKRWPGLAVDPALPPGDPARAGQEVFAVNCLVCHPLNHGGGAEIGPDLNVPMNPLEYLQPQALIKLIRDPASVRSWPNRQMNAFDPQVLSDHEIELLIAYLKHMSGRKIF